MHRDTLAQPRRLPSAMMRRSSWATAPSPTTDQGSDGQQPAWFQELDCAQPKPQIQRFRPVDGRSLNEI